MGDIGFKGPMFTWQARFQRAQCIHGLAIGSDHTPICLVLDHSDGRGVRSFKFEQMWFEYPEFQTIIKHAWTTGG